MEDSGSDAPAQHHYGTRMGPNRGRLAQASRWRAFSRHHFHEQPQWNTAGTWRMVCLTISPTIEDGPALAREHSLFA